jgi:hypothetical protein
LASSEHEQTAFGSGKQWWRMVFSSELTSGGVCGIQTCSGKYTAINLPRSRSSSMSVPRQRLSPAHINAR